MATGTGKLILMSICVSLLKFLFIPTYRSTDFEVHRNWLAVTHTLPIKQWYTDETSSWTLDYPPLFAWFEYGLSQIAVKVDPGMVKLTNLNYSSTKTIWFQRTSVIISDLVLLIAIVKFAAKFPRQSKPNRDGNNLEWIDNGALVSGVLLAANVGLLIVDHIHFQYNGFLFGVLLLSIICVFEAMYIESALLFSVLLNLKHIFIYVAPVYFVYFLRMFVFQSKPDGSLSLRSFSPVRLVQLSVTVTGVFIASFYPFYDQGVLKNVMRRLFPFKRGLCHAYWAPNFWALYNVVDKVLVMAGQHSDLFGPIKLSNASMTGGLVQQYDHVILPSILPRTTLIVTLVTTLPCLMKLWLQPTGPRNFVQCLVLCAFSSFLFGWHVHEKAILMVVIPLTCIALHTKRLSRYFIIVSTVGHFSILPLLFTSFEIPLKIAMWLSYFMYTILALQRFHRDAEQGWRFPLLSFLESVYLILLLPIELYKVFLHNLLPISRVYPFIPLLITSVYSSVGLIYAWVGLYWGYIAAPSSKQKVN